MMPLSTKKQAKQIFGDKNPVGASIRLNKSYGNYQVEIGGMSIKTYH